MLQAALGLLDGVLAQCLLAQCLLAITNETMDPVWDWVGNSMF